MIHTGQSHIHKPDGTDALEFCVLLTDEEREEIRTIIDEFSPFDLLNIDDDLLTLVELAGKRMPSRIADLLIRFRRNPNPYGALLFRNVPLDSSLPFTPQDGRYSKEKTSHVSEYVLLLFMLFLGEPIAYLDEKEGRLIQDICPVPGQEDKQENTGPRFWSFIRRTGSIRTSRIIWPCIACVPIMSRSPRRQPLPFAMCCMSYPARRSRCCDSRCTDSECQRHLQAESKSILRPNWLC